MCPYYQNNSNSLGNIQIVFSLIAHLLSTFITGSILSLDQKTKCSIFSPAYYWYDEEYTCLPIFYTHLCQFCKHQPYKLFFHKPIEFTTSIYSHDDSNNRPFMLSLLYHLFGANTILFDSVLRN